MKGKPHTHVSTIKKGPNVKSLFITFTSIYIPLLGIICVVLFSKQSALTPEFVLLSTLSFTVFATLVAFFLGKKLHPSDEG